MGVGPGQSLSCHQSAHSGSRDLPRGLGGSPGEMRVGCVLGDKGTDSKGPRKFFCFVLFCCCCFHLFDFYLLIYFLFI